MAGWYYALFSGAIISGSSLQQITGIDPTTWYGLGIAVSPYENHLSYNHDGSGVGYTSQMWYDVQTHVVLCLLMNYRTGNFNNRVFPLIRVLYHDAPKQQNDAGISKILAPWDNSCGETQIPSVILTNFGSAPLTSVTIKFKIDEGAPVTYNWTGSLNTGSTVNVVMPQITAGEGFHTFTCYTTFPNGAPEGYTYNDTTKSNFTVTSLPAALSEISESFDGPDFPPVGWTVNSSSFWQWGTTPLAYLNGTGAAVKNNYYDDQYGEHYDLGLPLVQVDGGTHPMLDFDWAHANYPGSYGDTLQILISTDCGNTWQKLFNKGCLGLVTSPPKNYPFYPQTSAEWEDESISLASYTGDVFIRFRDIPGFSNNLYLDNVNVSFQVGITNKKTPDSFTVYPNPTSNEINITGLPANSEIQITDLTGKLLMAQKTTNTLTALDVHQFPQGVYILKSMMGVKKIVKM